MNISITTRGGNIWVPAGRDWGSAWLWGEGRGFGIWLWRVEVGVRDEGTQCQIVLVSSAVNVDSIYNSDETFSDPLKGHFQSLAAISMVIFNIYFPLIPFCYDDNTFNVFYFNVFWIRVVVMSCSVNRIYPRVINLEHWSRNFSSKIVFTLFRIVSKVTSILKLLTLIVVMKRLQWDSLSRERTSVEQQRLSWSPSLLCRWLNETLPEHFTK